MWEWSTFSIVLIAIIPNHSLGSIDPGRYCNQTESQLDIYGALNNLPLLNSPTESETNQATGTEDKHTNDSKVVSLISDNPPALRTFQDVSTETEHSSRLVSPKTFPKETIQDDCSGLGKLSAEKAKQEKPQENTCFPELSSVVLTGFEPATSTPPV